MTAATRPTAFVTGASRGIGKAIAVRLAEAGYDVAITARTVAEGERREHSSSLARSDTSPLPGSLSTTADLIRAHGRQALVLPADLLDRASLGAAATTVLERWKRVDLVVHNARFIGPGHMDSLLDTPVEVLEKHVQGNAIAPLILNRYFLPAMIAQGGGTFVNITSAAALARRPSRSAKVAGGSATAFRRRRSTASPASSRSNMARTMSAASTSSRVSSPPKGSPRTWPGSVSRRTWERRPRSSPRLCCG